MLTQVSPGGDVPSPAFPELGVDEDDGLPTHTKLSPWAASKGIRLPGFPPWQWAGVSAPPLPVLLFHTLSLPSLFHASLFLNAFLRQSVACGQTVSGGPAVLHSHEGKSAPVAQVKLSQATENREQAL